MVMLSVGASERARARPFVKMGVPGNCELVKFDPSSFCSATLLRTIVRFRTLGPRWDNGFAGFHLPVSHLTAPWAPKRRLSAVPTCLISIAHQVF